MLAGLYTGTLAVVYGIINIGQCVMLLSYRYFLVYAGGLTMLYGIINIGQCVMTFSCQYFLVYGGLQICSTLGPPAVYSFWAPIYNKHVFMFSKLSSVGRTEEGGNSKFIPQPINSDWAYTWPANLRQLKGYGLSSRRRRR